MASSIFGSQNTTPAQIQNPINQTLGLMSALQNQTKSMQAALQSNPKYQEVMELIAKAGGDPKTAFYNLAREKGVDPNAFLKAMQQK